MRAELKINTPPDAAWLIVGKQFGRVGECACPITESSIDGQPGVGVARTCQIAGFGPVAPGVIRERLTVFDLAGRRLEFPEHELVSAQLVAVDRVLARVLAGQEPFPAWVVQQPFTFVRANNAAEALFPGLTGLPAEQLVDVWFGPRPVPRRRQELAGRRAGGPSRAAPGCCRHRRSAGHRFANGKPRQRPG